MKWYNKSIMRIAVWRKLELELDGSWSSTRTRIRSNPEIELQHCWTKRASWGELQLSRQLDLKVALSFVNLHLEIIMIWPEDWFLSISQTVQHRYAKTFLAYFSMKRFTAALPSLSLFSPSRTRLLEIYPCFTHSAPRKRRLHPNLRKYPNAAPATQTILLTEELARGARLPTEYNSSRAHF